MDLDPAWTFLWPLKEIFRQIGSKIFEIVNSKDTDSGIQLKTVPPDPQLDLRPLFYTATMTFC
jgi:hypothetical protein